MKCLLSSNCSFKLLKSFFIISSMHKISKGDFSPEGPDRYLNTLIRNFRMTPSINELQDKISTSTESLGISSSSKSSRFANLTKKSKIESEEVIQEKVEITLALFIVSRCGFLRFKLAIENRLRINKILRYLIARFFKKYLTKFSANRSKE